MVLLVRQLFGYLLYNLNAGLLHVYVWGRGREEREDGGGEREGRGLFMNYIIMVGCYIIYFS